MSASSVGALDTNSHKFLIYGLIRSLKPEVVVEVGCFVGGTSVWIARALQENGTGMLYAIDDFSLSKDSKQILSYNLGACNVGPVVRLIEGRSDEVEWPVKVDFAFVDGLHSYEGCKRDVEKAVESGARCIAVHDTVDWWGPRRWAEEFRSMDGWDLLEFYHESGLSIATKKMPKEEPNYHESDFPEGAVESMA